jgi:hypothetical protein
MWKRSQNLASPPLSSLSGERMETTLKDGRGRSLGSGRTQFQPGPDPRRCTRPKAERKTDPMKKVIPVKCRDCGKTVWFPASILDDFAYLPHVCGGLISLREYKPRVTHPAPDPQPVLPSQRNLVLCRLCQPHGYPHCPRCVLMNDPTTIQGGHGVIYRELPDMARKWRLSRGYPI